MVRLLPSGALRRITVSGTPARPETEWKRNSANPHRSSPRRPRYPLTAISRGRYVVRVTHESRRSPSRRVVVKLGSWSACADGAPQQCGAPSSYPGSRHPDRTHPHAVSALGSGPDARTDPRSGSMCRSNSARISGRDANVPAVAGRACPVIGQSASRSTVWILRPIPRQSPMPPKPRFDKAS